MDKNMLKIVKTCEEKSLAGQTDIDVFDLMYELNLSYDSLKCVLDKLVINKKLAQKDSGEKSFLEFKKERENVIFEFLKLDNDIESPNIFIKFILKKLIEIKRLRQILLQKKYDLF